MTRTNKLGTYLLFGFLLSLSVLIVGQRGAKAAEIILPSEYYFVFNGQNKETGTEYEMKAAQVLLSVTAKGWAPETTVTWISSEPGAITLEPTSYGSNFVKMVRKGPGYSTITAIVKHGTNTYSLSSVVKVDLSFDAAKTGLDVATTTKEKILVLNGVNDSKPIYLKYVDYQSDDGTVIGGDISSGAVTWESDNEGVAVVDQNGLVKATGSGSSIITVTSSTMSSKDRPLSITMRVVVSPKFVLTFDNGTDIIKKESTPDPKTATPVIGVPSSFNIESHATMATNLKWVVKDNEGKVLPVSGPKMSYSISDLSGNVTFSNVKAGTYEIFAFADKNYNEGTNAPYAYMKIIVPIVVADRNIVMEVHDTYSIAENTNIPNVQMFTYSYIQGNANIAEVNDKGIITAKRKGKVKLRLTYQTEYKLYDDKVILDGGVEVSIDIDITVIDGIALDTTNATIYTSGTMMLQAIVTEPTIGLTWESSDPKIATVDNGLVKGIKPGVVTITVYQKIDGIVKKATCKITVQQSISTITVDRPNVTLAIGGYETLYATVTPKNLVGVNLTWKSSNEKVVKIVDSGAITATIQGMAGGNAVISAINQDNVVVGYSHITVQQPVSSIALSETEVTVNLSLKRLQLRATVYLENATNKKVTWKSTDTKVATVNENGLVTFIKAGKVSIIATSDDNAKATAICNINIDVSVATIVVDEKELTMYSGESKRLNYSVLPLNANNISIVWTSSNTSIATVDSVGRITAKGVGTAIIMARTVDGSYTAYVTVHVKKLATGIKITESTVSVNAGDSHYLKAELTPKDSTDSYITWESSDTKIVTVDTNGKITGKSAGIAIIMARTETGAMAYTKITVNEKVKGLILNYEEKTIYTGENFKLKASVTPSKASQLGVTYKSSNASIASVDEDGVVIGHVGGTAVITVTTLEGGYVATCVVTVRELVTSITMSHENIKIGKGVIFHLEAVVSTQTATNKKVKWKSSNTRIATVNSKGKVTGVSYGNAVITAIAQDGSEVEATTEVQVVRPVTKVTVNKSYLNMLVGDVYELKATVSPQNATYKDVQWISSDNTIAIVDDDGVVTALKAGSVTITAKALDDSGKKAVTQITVNNRVPSTKVSLANTKITMVVGETRIEEPKKEPVNTTDSVTWSSDNVGVAKVNKNTGKISAVSTGTAYITVMTDSGKSARIEINVIGLNRSKIELEQYTEAYLFVEGASGTVRWHVANSKIATVTNGRVVSRGIGTTTVYATVNGRQIACKVTVTKIK